MLDILGCLLLLHLHRQTGLEGGLSGGDEKREKPGEFPRSSLGSPKASLHGQASASGDLCSVLGKAWEFSDD